MKDFWHPEIADLGFSLTLIVITALIWLLWDMYAYIKDKKTISYYFTKLSFYSPMVPFILGMLISHWFGWTPYGCQ